MGDVIEILTTATNTVEVEAQGPQGIPGVGVPTGGSTGQVLRKASGADYATEWAAAGSGSGSVTSVALASSDLTITGSPITSSGTITANIAANAVTLEKLQTISSEHLLGRHGNGNGGVQQVGLGTGLAMSGSNVRVATTGITAGTYTKLTIDETGRATVGATATASDVGAVSLLEYEPTTITSETTLTAARAKRYTCAATGSPYTITLPTSGNQNGDLVLMVCLTTNGTISIGGTTLTTAGQQRTFFYRGDVNVWSLLSPDTHFHSADDITTGIFSISRIPTGTSESTVALGNHTHGNLTNDGKLGSTAGLPVVTTTAGAVTTLALGTANQVLRVNSGATGVEFADPAASGVTGAASSASDVLGVSGANITGVDANADRIVYWNNTSNKLAYGTPADAGAAAASHTHTSADINSQTASNGHVLTANGSGGSSFAALPASGISNVDATLADVMSVSGSNLVADDGGLVDSSNPALVWDDAAGKAVWANPLRRTSSGAFYVGLAPTTTALGTNAINIQTNRIAADRVASGTDGTAVGNSSQASGNQSSAYGFRARATALYSVAVGGESVASGSNAIAIGEAVNATAQSAIALGGYTAGGDASAINAVALNQNANLRGQLSTRPFQAVYWGGQTTNNTATILNLDATATNRFTIAANTALAVDILLVARRSDTADKWLVARRFLGIRRDGSNNTSLIGTVQNFGMTDQSGGSPTWSFALTADDTNDALQLEVTGATGETVQWRACAIYRVV